MKTYTDIYVSMENEDAVEMAKEVLVKMAFGNNKAIEQIKATKSEKSIECQVEGLDAKEFNINVYAEIMQSVCKISYANRSS